MGTGWRPPEERLLRAVFLQHPRVVAACWCALAVLRVVFARDIESSLGDLWRGIGWALLGLLTLPFCWYGLRLLACLWSAQARQGWLRALLVVATIGLVPWGRDSWLSHWLFFARWRPALAVSLRDGGDVGRGERHTEPGGVVFWTFPFTLADAYWIVYDPSGEAANDRRGGHLEGDWYWTYH
jgi:hypothetical protein